MAVHVGLSVTESRGEQAEARIGTGMAGAEGAATAVAGTEADAASVGTEPVQSGLASAPVPSRRGLFARVWRSWLRHWLRYAEVVGAQWR